MESLRYIGYVRKSTEDEEKQVLSIQAQKNKIHEQFKGIKVVGIYEESKSAFEPGKRPVFQQIMEMLDAGKADGIVAWHPDRLSRNEVDGSAVTWRIRQNIIKDLKFASFSFDNSPEGLMMLQMTMSQSQYFSAKLSKDVRRGNETKRKNGGITGLAPEGYLNDRLQKIIYPDPDRSALLRLGFERFLTGEHSVPSVLAYLNSECHYRTKFDRPLSRAGLYYILTNVRYAGWIPDPYDKEVFYKASYPPLLTMEEFDKIQMLLGRKGKPRLTSKKQFALRGLVKCGECGCSITAEDKVRTYSSGKTRTYVYYHCTRKRECSQRAFVSQDKLYIQVSELLDKFELVPQLYDWGMSALKEMSEKELTNRNDVQKMQNLSITQTQNKLDKLLDMATAGLIDDKTYLSKSNSLKDELNNLQADQASTADRVKNWYSFTAKTISDLTNANNKFKLGDLAEKKDILLAIGQNPLLLDGKLSITPNEWMVPIEQVAQSLKFDLESARTLPEQRQTEVMEALRLKWYPLLEVLRTKYHGVIVSIGKEVELAKQYLGVSPLFGFST